ncbi:NADH-quinone oxidoreductase subunit D [Sulfurihydrogenibium yellowstonense]|uniref:NADH-quinone oxidoreductase subunit C/D n=1 Tax=Sulfurihydrogenibium yellowstonense SS-5 TaxID=432331 RepID=C4FK47_9AQUI|nr:NADH-quinone oxidoreductase subunit D [Sulfurihydrogenibium yellowstonense]EEP60554.1 NADH-quinone oxidoreductase, subunit c/d [Sulfurihydrogenibium yellowstonense SS-5]
MAWISLEKAKKLEERFGYPKVSEGKGVVSVEVPKDKFIEFLTFLKEDPEYQFKMFIDLTIIDHGEKENPRFQGVVILFSPKNQERIIVKTWAENETLPTLTNLWKGAKWAEREAWDMFGIKFEGHENLVRMLLWETYPYHPLRKDFPLEGIKDTELPSLNESLRGENLEGLFNYDRMHTALPTMEDLEITQKKRMPVKTSQIVLNWGPLHPGTHGTIWFLFDLDGEYVKQCDIIIGQLHRGVEKLGENVNWQQFIPYTDRMDYIAAINENHAYVLAAEKMLGIEVPEKAKWIRTMMAELSRINSHLLWLGTYALDLGALTMFLYTFREREKIMDIIEGITGARFTINYFRIGGVFADLPYGALDAIEHLIKDLPQRINDYETLLTRNRIWLSRNKDVCIITEEDVYQYGLTGAVARGSGVPYDVRKIDKYDAYGEVEFDIPVGEKGDSYDRYLVRMEEMRQSIRIIAQCVAKLRKMSKNDPYFFQTPDEKKLKVTIDGRGMKLPAGETYASSDNPRGELGFYIYNKKDGLKAHRMRIRSGAFYNLQVFTKAIIGRPIADAITLLSTIDPVVGETDR